MSRIRVVGYMGLNFISSVGIIWTNKLAYNRGFTFAITLTILHFLLTFAGLRMTCRPKKLALTAVVPISIAFCGFVVFNNLSLQFNPVGTYQLLKVMTTPTIVLLQYVFYNARLPLIQLMSLVPVCLGVALATVASLETNLRGLGFGIAGIISTSIYQIWVKTEQTRLDCTAEELLYYQAPVSAVLLAFLLPVLEDTKNLVSFNWLSGECVLWVLISSILAFLVNLSIFLVIGKTSPLSYNVLGHAKLCVILVSGYVWFDESCSMKNLAGIVLAVGGIIWYTSLKLAAPLEPFNRKETAQEEGTE